MTAVIHPRRGIRDRVREFVQVDERTNVGYTLWVTVIALLNLISAVMVMSASSVASITAHGSTWFVAQRQLMWIALGAIAFFITARIDYRVWVRHLNALTIGVTLLLVAVLVPGVGIAVEGGRRWLGTDFLRFQPSEAAKLVLVLLLAQLLTRRANEVDDWRRTLAPAAVIFSILAALLLSEPDMDTTMVCALILGSMLVAGGIPGRQIGSLLGSGVVLSAILAVIAPYRRRRVFSFLDPWKVKNGSGWQLVQSQIAIGTGGWTGVGLGASRSKWTFLPNAHTDFIFAIIAEELGLIGALIVLALLAAVGVLGIRAAFRAPDRSGLLIAVGITTWFVGQALINIGGVIGLIPVSGITLPFISFGGSSLLFTMIAAGVLANIARLGNAAPLPRGRASLRPVRS